MDNDKPSEKKAESSTAKPAKKAPAKKAAAKSEKKVSIPPAPTADFPAVTPQPVSDVAPPAPAEAAEAEIVAVDPAPAAPSEMVKESQPVAAGDGEGDGEGEFVARHRADDDATQPADPDGATVRADDPSESMTDAEMVQLIQTPMRTPQPSRAPIVIGIVVLLLLRRRRRRRRQRMQAAGR